MSRNERWSDTVVFSSSNWLSKQEKSLNDCVPHLAIFECIHFDINIPARTPCPPILLSQWDNMWTWGEADRVM